MFQVVNKNHYKCKIVTECLFVLLTKLIVVSSLFKLKLITETYQWMLKLTTRPEHSLRTLEQYLGFHTTRKRFEPGHNPFTFPVVHSAPLKYNCSYHRGGSRGRVQGVRTPPPGVNLYSSYSLLKFVYLTSQ